MNRILTRFAIAVLVISTGVIIFQALRSEPPPGQVALLAGERAFADGHYDRAIENFREALEADPDRVEALRGKARSLLQQERFGEALTYFDLAIELEPSFAGTFANRGIAYDRMGDYEMALRDYERALRLDDSVAAGPGWVTRLLHMDGPPATIEQRADYLRQQLALPEEERVLAIPEVDRAQRTYQRRAAQ